MEMAGAVAVLLRSMPPLLITFWVLAAGSVIVTLLPVPLPESFKDAVRLSAARGKLWAIRPRTLGPLNVRLWRPAAGSSQHIDPGCWVELSVPQSWFSHFYAVGILSCTATILAYLGSSNPDHGPGEGQSQQDIPAVCVALALALFWAHLLRRYLETVLMMVYPKGARMHVIAYAFGLAYYLVVPLSLLPRHTWHSAAAAVESGVSTRAASTAGTGSSSAWAAGDGHSDTAQAHESGLLTAAAETLSSAVEATSTAADVVDFVASGASSVAGEGSAIGTVADAMSGLAGLVSSMADPVDSLTSSVGELHSAAKERLLQEEQAAVGTFQHQFSYPPWSLQGVGDITSMSGLTTAARQLATHAPKAAASVVSQVRGSLEALMAAQAWLPLLGAAIMVAGFLIQWHSHLLLARLASAATKSGTTGSKGSKRGSGSEVSQQSAQAAGAKDEGGGYVIPHGGLFSLVSCPHYLGEVVIYLGLSLLMVPPGPLLPLLMLNWVVVNLVLAAGATQAWYHKRFPDYPRSRRALIPFLY